MKTELKKTLKTELHITISTDALNRRGNWTKCLGSTEPKWPGSRGHLDPGGVQGQRPAGGSRVEKPPCRKQIWVFWRPVCCLSVHRNCENHFCFCFWLEVETSESTFHYFLCHTNQLKKNNNKTTNIKSDSQDHKIYQFPSEHFKIYVCMSHNLPDYQSGADSSFTKSYEQFIDEL